MSLLVLHRAKKRPGLIRSHLPILTLFCSSGLCCLDGLLLLLGFFLILSGCAIRTFLFPRRGSRCGCRLHTMASLLLIPGLLLLTLLLLGVLLILLIFLILRIGTFALLG